MEEEELNEIELRCSLATPGPWKSMIEGRDHTGGDSCIITGPENARGEDFYLTGATIADMDFIRPKKGLKPPPSRRAAFSYKAKF